MNNINELQSKITNCIGLNITAGILPLSEMVMKVIIQNVKVFNEWISIDTMPHTGAWVLLYNGHWKGVGKYEPDERNYDEGDTEHFTDWQDETGEFISPKPTHWQLLPESPHTPKI